ncbi:MAG: tyrosine-type recombinase/integrase [Saprospiraceae bacterium]|nr:tyrosine-type recombinase/integrase [Saprospiraceae bacterium]
MESNTNNTSIIHVSKGTHYGKTVIICSFAYDNTILNTLKTIPTLRYSKTLRSWYLPYTKEDWAAFTALRTPYQIENFGTTGSTKPISDHTDTNLVVMPPDCTKQAANNTISIRYHHPFFYLRGIDLYQIPILKSIPNTYWNDRYKNWVIPATTTSLQMLAADLNIISKQQQDIWVNQIALLSNPPICSLYSSPEFPDKVVIQLTGHCIDVDFVKHIPERKYHGEKKIWLIPGDVKIITRITDHYTSKGTKVINRIKLNHVKSKKPTYPELKTYLVSKSDENIRYACIPYIDTLITQRYSISTIREYFSKFAQYVSYLYPKQCNEVNEAVINSYLCEISGKKASESLINSYINAIKFYYEKVIYLPQLKIERIKRPRTGHYLPKVLSVQQVDATLRATENIKHIALLYALYGHGFRLNEVLNIRLYDLLWDRNQIFVHKGKGNKDRYIPMSQEFKSLMQLYIHTYKPQYWLFEGQDQKSQYSERSVQQVVSQSAKKAGVPIKVTPHMLRHSYATHLLDVGTQLPYIKELLGHKDIKTTMIYTHVTTASIENVVSPLDRLREK